MAVAICAGCGATVATGEKFCPTCARALVATERDALELRELRRRERSRRELQMLLFVFVVIMALGYYFLR